MLKLNLQFFSDNPIIEKLAIGEEGTYDISDALALHTSDVVQATGSSTTAIMSQKAVTNALNGKSNFSGNYNDLTNKPTIPTRGVVIQPNNQSTVTYFKISNFGTWYGLANNEKVSLLIGSRSGETILFTLAGETATTMEGSALRLNNHYSKILGIYYKISENAIYVSLGDWARILSVDVLSDKSGNYTPIVEQIDALPTDAADAAVDAKLITVPIVPFGSHYTAGIVVGNTAQNLVFGGKNARPTYNGSNMALQSEVPSTTENWTFTLEDGSTVTKAVYVK